MITTTALNWLRWRAVTYGLSLGVLILASAGLLLGGLRPALEFTGGAELILRGSSVATLQETVESTSTQQELDLVDQRVGDNQIGLNFRGMTESQKNIFVEALQDQANTELTVDRFQNVGPAVSSDLIKKTAYAIVLGVMVILGYVWWQFKNWRFGLAAVLAMLHDSFILVGAFAWLGYLYGVEVDLLFVTAVLTTLSFSVHDTIVVFDRLREIKSLERGKSEAFTANQAITQTLSRSLNNSLTILLMLATLLLLGGESLRWFATALFVGTLTGTYSSTFTAMPLYFDLQKRFN